MAFRGGEVRPEEALRFAVRFSGWKTKRLLSAALVREFGGHFEGFFTEELVENGRRSGYLLRSLSGEEAVLASTGIVSPVSFNKYALDLSALDGLASACVERALAARRPLFADELGAMTLRSARFSAALASAVAAELPMAVFMRGGGGAFGETFGLLDGVFEVDLDEAGYTAAAELFRRWAAGRAIRKAGK